MGDFLKKPAVEYFIIGLIICGVLLVVFNPSIGLVQQGANFAVHFTLAYLLCGLFFLAINQRKLMLTSFGACVVLCLFLKGASNSSFLFPKINRGPNLKIAHIDLSAADGNQDIFMKSILQLDADVISFQEVEPMWSVIFEFYLEEKYPHNLSNIRIDPFGMAIYSKTPFIAKDTLVIEEYPTLLSTLFVDNQKSVSIMSSYTMPNLDANFKLRNRRYYTQLAQEILKSKVPVINLGKYNMTYWNNELTTFESRADLEHSRRDAVAASLKPPIDNIYFTKELECTGLEEVLGSGNSHVGIIGTYQFKEEEQKVGQNEIPTVERF